MIPHVLPFTATQFDAVKLGQAILQLHTFLQLFDDLGRDFTAHTHRVFTLDLHRWMHQTIGQLAIGGEDDQTIGVDVETADRDPTTAAQLRHRIKDRAPSFGIRARTDLTFRLVVDKHALFVIRAFVQANDMPVDTDAIRQLGLVADLGHLAIHTHAQIANHLLDLTTGTDAGIRQQFLNTFSHNV